jgi:hypothetical protein
VKYLLLIHWDETAGARRPAAEEQAEMAEHRAYGQALGARRLGGDRLRPSGEARCVTTRGGRRTVTDGPYAETKEVLGGYYLIECADAAEALEWAARCPSAKHGTIEVRPVWSA